MSTLQAQIRQCTDRVRLELDIIDADYAACRISEEGDWATVAMNALHEAIENAVNSGALFFDQCVEVIIEHLDRHPKDSLRVMAALNFHVLDDMSGGDSQ